MATGNVDVLAELRLIRERLPEDDERIAVIESLIHDRKPDAKQSAVQSNSPKPRPLFTAVELPPAAAEMGGQSASSADANLASADPEPAFSDTSQVLQSIEPEPMAADKLELVAAFAPKPTPALWHFPDTPDETIAPLMADKAERRSTMMETLLVTSLAGATIFLGWITFGPIRGRAQAARPAGTAIVRPAAPAAVASSSQPIISPAVWLSRGKPDPALTPGELSDEVQSAGMVDPAVRSSVFQSYGLSADDRRYSIAHLIPVSLGGTDGPRNLFPIKKGAGEMKVRLDKRLAELVATGRLAREQAVSELEVDWLASTHAHYVRNYGYHSKRAARRREDRRLWLSSAASN